MFSLRYLKVLVDLIRARETKRREMDGGGNAGGNKRNVGELLAAARPICSCSDSSRCEKHQSFVF